MEMLELHSARRDGSPFDGIDSPTELCDRLLTMAEGNIDRDGDCAPICFFMIEEHYAVTLIPPLRDADDKDRVSFMLRTLVKKLKPYAVATVFEAWMKMAKTDGSDGLESFQNYRDGDLAEDLESKEAVVVTVEWKDSPVTFGCFEMERGIDGDVVACVNRSVKTYEDGYAEGSRFGDLMSALEE